MNIRTNTSIIQLWRDVIQEAEKKCEIALEEQLEAYLVTLLARFTDKPQIAKKIFATAFLEALHLTENQRAVCLQNVGDCCLLMAGLFPRAAERRLVKIGYFVDLGRAAYSGIHASNDLFNALAVSFVVLMDVLQSIPYNAGLLPLEAYEQWHDLGSNRALKILQSYTLAMPLKKF